MQHKDNTVDEDDRGDELLGEIENSPSNSPSKTDISPSKKRKCGSGSMYCRTITKNGTSYSQAYYHWRENGKKRTKYVPSECVKVIQKAIEKECPVIKILAYLEDAISSLDLLGEIENSPSNSPSKTDISPSKMRHKGEGGGSIHWRIITKNGKDYPQAYYHYEFWSNGNCQIKSSRYIPKRLVPQIQQLESDKVPVRDILKVLGVHL